MCRQILLVLGEHGWNDLANLAVGGGSISVHQCCVCVGLSLYISAVCVWAILSR